MAETGGALWGRLTPEELGILAQLDGPARVQAFLDDTPYSDEQAYRCPLMVLRERKAHCFDGALFAAAALRRLGHRPAVLEMVPNESDDVHLLALYRCQGHWGAVAKSNFVGLRFREPIYRTLRELVLSYFEQYYNVAGEKTLRGYRRPVDLGAFDRLQWEVSSASLEVIAAHLDKRSVVPLLASSMIAQLSPVDERTYRAGLMGADAGGLYRLPVER